MSSYFGICPISISLSLFLFSLTTILIYSILSNADEKGLPDPTFQKKSTSSNNNNLNPDVTNFFGTSSSGSSNNLGDESAYDTLEEYINLANLFGTLRDRSNSRTNDSNQEFLDNLISQLLEEANASSRGPPPASKKFIQSLPIVKKSEIKSECILPWLKLVSHTSNISHSISFTFNFSIFIFNGFDFCKKHNTCPSCRHEVDSDDPAWRKKQLELQRAQDSEEEDQDWMYG
ncbi:12344_t:CDS:2 [Cetraspora pellucida]|uniref:12344_t:CDS:1 n=1 Tax=Cetraspora pellucida TaxID=1433469 RepID=A0A9N9HKG3_9GLOM|nr:12344_t:CDS:2 [Cetraspora pellucida]